MKNRLMAVLLGLLPFGASADVRVEVKDGGVSVSAIYLFCGSGSSPNPELIDSIEIQIPVLEAPGKILVRTGGPLKPSQDSTKPPEIGHPNPTCLSIGSEFESELISPSELSKGRTYQVFVNGKEQPSIDVHADEERIGTCEHVSGINGDVDYLSAYRDKSNPLTGRLRFINANPSASISYPATLKYEESKNRVLVIAQGNLSLPLVRSSTMVRTEWDENVWDCRGTF